MNNQPAKSLKYILIILSALLVVVIGVVIFLLGEVRALKGNRAGIIGEFPAPEVSGPPRLGTLSLARFENEEFTAAQQFKQGEEIGVIGEVENISPGGKVVIDYQVLDKDGEKIKELKDWFGVIRSSSTSNITSCCLGLVKDLLPGNYTVRFILNGQAVKDLPLSLIE